MAINEAKAKLEKANALIEEAPFAEAAAPLESQLPSQLIHKLGIFILSLAPVAEELKTVPSYVEQVKTKAAASQEILLGLMGEPTAAQIHAAINAIGVMSTETTAYGEHTEIMSGKLRDAVQHMVRATISLGEYEQMWAVASENIVVSTEAAVVAQETIDKVIEIT